MRFAFVLALAILSLVSPGCSEKSEKANTAAAVPKPANKPPAIDPTVKYTHNFEYDEFGRMAGVTTEFEVTASDPDGDRVTYEWKTTGGKLTPKDNTATLQGAEVGNITTVTVRDGKGGSATYEFKRED